jgi:arylsulfatase A-like enzyme
MVMVDDLGWRDLEVPAGSPPLPAPPGLRTPNALRLAAEGVVFTRAYASAPVCTPTRVAWMTGLDPAATGVTWWTLRADADVSTEHPALAPPAWRVNGLGEEDVTLAGLLRDAGYATIHVGKAHLGADGTPGADPTRLGFEVSVAGHAAGAPGSYLGEDDIIRYEDVYARGQGAKG